MEILNYIVLALFAASILFLTFFGQLVLRLSPNRRLALMLAFTVVFGGWIVGMNVL